MNKIKDYIKFLIGWPLSFLSLIIIFNYLISKTAQIFNILHNINLLYLSISFIFLLFFWLLRTVLWKLFIENLGVNIGVIENAYKFEISEIKRFVPGNIWSYLSRVFLFSKYNLKKEELAQCILLEVEAVIIGGFLSSLLSIPFILNSNNQLFLKLSAILPISILFIVAYFIGIMYIFKKRYLKNNSYVSLIILPGLSTLVKIKIIFFSTFIFYFFGIANYFILLSFLPSIGFTHLISLSAFFTFSFLVGYLSFITPMGLGVREGVTTLGLLALMGLTPASFFSIFARIINIISELFFLILIILLNKIHR